MKTMPREHPDWLIFAFFRLLVTMVVFCAPSALGIAKVQLVSPSNGATDVSPCVTLVWDAASGATGYYYEVMSNSLVVMAGGSGGATQVSLTLSPGTTYQWQVQGRTSKNTGPFSGTWTFTTKPPIPAPTLTSPANGASLTSLNVTLQWSALGDATFYGFEVDNASGIVTNGSMTASTNSLSLTLPEGSYTWRIYGFTSCMQGPWSAYSAFTIPPIPVPTLVAPPNGGENDSLNVTLVWDSVGASATFYNYQVNDMNGNSVTNANVTGETNNVTIALAEGAYTWEVRGATTARTSVWSSPFTFTIPPIPTPTLVAPADGSETDSNNVTLVWDSVGPSATFYNFRVDDINGNSVTNGNVTGENTNVTITLADGTYTWEVQGATSARTGAWSGVFAFTITLPPPVQIFPTNYSTGIGLQPTLQWEAVPEATGYDYELYLGDGDALIGSSSISGLSAQVNPGLSENAIYSWRVRGHTSLLEGIWSPLASFTTVPPSSPESPEIILQPAGTIVTTEPTNVTFTVVASGSPLLSYQWHFIDSNSVDNVLVDSTNVIGSTSNTLTLFNVQPQDAGNYYVTVSNLYGQTVSTIAELLFQPPAANNPFSIVSAGLPPMGGVPPVTGSGPGIVAYLEITILPTNAVQAGAGWRFSAGTNYISNPDFAALVPQSTNLVVEFNPILGWYVPTNTSITVTANELTTITVYYIPAPVMAVNPAQGLNAAGYAGGPIFASNLTYTISNTGNTNLDWWTEAAESAPGWLSLTPTNGILVAGRSTNVILAVSTNIYGLGASTFPGTVAFANLDNTVGNTNFPINLTLQTHPDVLLKDVCTSNNGNMQVTLDGIQGVAYTILSSSNLMAPVSNWIPVMTITNTTGANTFAIPAPAFPPQYYRVKELRSN